MHRMICRASAMLALGIFAAAVPAVRGQAPAPPKVAVGTAVPPGHALDNILTIVETEFVGAADAMPEDKYGFVPTAGDFKDVRSFGDQVKHVIQANTYFFAAPGASQDEIKAKQAATDKLKSKAEIMQALKDSFAQAHAYVNGISADNASVTITPGGQTRTTMASFGMAHMMDHYGQLVVYLRMNGIIPPASRK